MPKTVKRSAKKKAKAKTESRRRAATPLKKKRKTSATKVSTKRKSTRKSLTKVTVLNQKSLRKKTVNATLVAASAASPSQKELSGSIWVSRYPGSNKIDDLISPYRENVRKFFDALNDAGASVSIGATYRPKERAYLMQTAWDIAKGKIKAVNAPTLEGVDIEWVHATEADSVANAQHMVDGYRIVYRPAFPTKHSDRTAIDMSVSWTGTLAIENADGSVTSITSAPRDNDNVELHAVGSTYHVIKLVNDKPHWSDDGH